MFKDVLCPVHNVKMKKVEIVYGFLLEPWDMSEDAIYGGCVIPVKKIEWRKKKLEVEILYKYGYICPECRKLFSGVEQKFAYVVKDGKVIPFNKAIKEYFDELRKK